MTQRFAMVGTGVMAEAMMPAFQYVEGAELCAVSSSELNRAQAFAKKFGIAKAYAGLKELLKDDEIDAIYVANRTADHVETSILALQAGKHVLCEKPFAMNAVDGARVIAAAKDSGKLFMEALWTLFLPAYQRAFEGITSGELGAPQRLIAGYGYPTSQTAKPRLFDARDGGVLLDLGVYPISFALTFFGDVDHLDAVVKRNDDGVDTHLSLEMKHKNGAISQLTASFDVLTSNAALISGSKKQIRIPAPIFGAEYVVIEPSDTNGAILNAKTPQWKERLTQNPLLRRIHRLIANDGEHHAYGANQYLPQLQHFVDAIGAGKSESDIATHALSLNVMDVIDQIRTNEEG